jgi:hypothetical protein
MSGIPSPIKMGTTWIMNSSISFSSKNAAMIPPAESSVGTGPYLSDFVVNRDPASAQAVFVYANHSSVLVC